MSVIVKGAWRGESRKPFPSVCQYYTLFILDYLCNHKLIFSKHVEFHSDFGLFPRARSRGISMVCYRSDFQMVSIPQLFQ